MATGTLHGGAGLRWAIAAALALAALAGLWALAPSNAPAAQAPLSADRAQVAARRAEAAFADAQAVFAALFRAELGREYAPARLRHFSRSSVSSCAGADAATGPFYCAADRIVGADLAFLDALGGRLRQDAQRGAAVFVARIVASHAAAELGLPAGAEAGDCLVAIWARDAATRIGAVSPDLYGRMLTSAREVVAEQAAAGGWRDAALFAPGTRTARQAAFARGLDAGALAGCGAG